MNIIRHALVALAPFAFGIVLGLLVAPTDGHARERTDFVAASPMADIRCTTLARTVASTRFLLLFDLHAFRLPGGSTCELQALSPGAPMAPMAAFGRARALFVWGE